MDKLEHLIKRLEYFNDNIEEIAVQTTRQFEAEILDMNTENQLMKGVDADGDSLGKYAPLTISIKQAKGQPTDRVTLKDTGDFHQSFFARFNGKFITIGATDEKAQKLEDGYGKAIYGLSDKNVQELIDLLRPEMISEFRKQIIGS